MPRVAARSPIPVIVPALLLAVASAAAVWPGIAAYDATTQFAQAVTGQYDDWHPPIMARVWSLFLEAGAWGTAPMLLLQLALYWGGLALLALALPRGRWIALMAGLLPPVIDWMVVVDKDAQLIGALVAATGLLAVFRLGRKPLPAWATALLLLLLGYAVLLRANSAFAVVPLALAWAGWFGVRRWWRRAVLVLAATAAVIVASGPINHRLLRAEPSGVGYTLPIFDLAGIAHRAPLATLPGLSAEQWRRAERLGCYTPFYWDPFADPARCAAMGNELVSDVKGPPTLFHDWAAAIVRHPLAYAEHRLAHLNATLRVRVPADERSAAAPSGTPANLYGIGARASAVSLALASASAAVERTPAGAPAVWLALASLIGWVLLATPAQPARELSLSLVLSAVLMTASFAVVSIASDLRYHLWLMMATTLAAVLLASCRGVPAGRLAASAAVLVLVCAASIMLRSGAPAIAY